MITHHIIEVYLLTKTDTLTVKVIKDACPIDMIRNMLEQFLSD